MTDQSQRFDLTHEFNHVLENAYGTVPGPKVSWVQESYNDYLILLTAEHAAGATPGAGDAVHASVQRRLPGRAGLPAAVRPDRELRHRGAGRLVGERARRLLHRHHRVPLQRSVPAVRRPARRPALLRRRVGAGQDDRADPADHDAPDGHRARAVHGAGVRRARRAGRLPGAVGQHPARRQRRDVPGHDQQCRRASPHEREPAPALHGAQQHPDRRQLRARRRSR